MLRQLLLLQLKPLAHQLATVLVDHVQVSCVHRVEGKGNGGCAKGLEQNIHLEAGVCHVHGLHDSRLLRRVAHLGDHGLDSVEAVHGTLDHGVVAVLHAVLDVAELPREGVHGGVAHALPLRLLLDLDARLRHLRPLLLLRERVALTVRPVRLLVGEVGHGLGDGAADGLGALLDGVEDGRGHLGAFLDDVLGCLVGGARRRLDRRRRALHGVRGLLHCLVLARRVHRPVLGLLQLLPRSRRVAGGHRPRP
mmetsp:Transcript_15293/g.59779  ORF Transcript_15293/g.59779 Transcript_15293/m.59779 type:complete len:251 (-) Transcript_15293:385-1137(-)